jgi:hypothetical protein
MGSWIPTAFLRPRAVFLSVMIVVVAVLVARGARLQKEAGSQGVAQWVGEAVRRAEADRGQVPPLGATDPFVASAFAAWVRESMPANRAGEASVLVAPLGAGFFGVGEGEATHRASVTLLGARAEVDVRWKERREGGYAGTIVAFRIVPGDAVPGVAGGPSIPSPAAGAPRGGSAAPDAPSLPPR